MSEFFIVSNSFAMPFVSETSHHYVEGNDVKSALEKHRKDYGKYLYAAFAYESADSYHKKGKPIAKWLCNKELTRLELTKGKSSYSSYSSGSDHIEIDGESRKIDDPHGGQVIFDD